MTAIDFTGSNGESTSWFAHHEKDPQKKKMEAAALYATAITDIGQVLLTYDSDGHFPVYGFRGDRCFALNGHEEAPYVHGIRGMNEAFHMALSWTDLSGPPCLVPVIQKAASLARHR